MKLEEINASDFVLAFKILNDIGSPWKDFNAYKAGLIDDSGKRLKKSDSSTKDSLTSYDKIIINLKRLLQKAVGKNKIVQRIATTFLLKESIDSSRTINIILEKLDLDNLEKNSLLIEEQKDSRSTDLIYSRTLVEATIVL